MKRKFLSVALAIMCVLVGFAFAGCTDDDDDEYRQINVIEQSIVGEWTSDASNNLYTFKVDGTYTASQDIVGSNPAKKEFYQKGDGIESQRGHYYIIVLYSSNGSERERYALFDNEPDKLAWITPGTVNEINDFSLFRVFHNAV